MTAVLDRPTTVLPEVRVAPVAPPPSAPPDRARRPEPEPQPAQRPRVRRWIDTAIAWPLGVSIVVLLAWNITGFPAASDDEGTYLAQSWAVREGVGLAHYTYWYDHPPLGWLQLATMSWLPQLVAPEAMAVGAGRVAMLPIALITLVLTYVLCRRLGFARWAAALAMLLYGLSPLAVTMMRQIYLDSFAVMWMLAALILALTPRRHLWAYTGAGVAVGLAVLSKETIAVVLPAVIVALWQSTRRTPIRSWAVTGFVIGMVLVGASYPLYAMLKGELFPGADHVSLLGALEFQLHSRSGSGSAFAGGSGSNTLVNAWLFYDPVLPIGGVVAALLAVLTRRLWVPAVAVLMLVLVAVRPGGYLPAMYIVQALPFLAILLAGVTQGVVGALLWGRWRGARARMRLARMRIVTTLRRIGSHRWTGVLIGWIGQAVHAVVSHRRIEPALRLLDRGVQGVGAALRAAVGSIRRWLGSALIRGKVAVGRWLATARRRFTSSGRVTPVLRRLGASLRWAGRLRPTAAGWRRIRFGLRVGAVAGLAGLALAVVVPRWYVGDRRAVVADANGPYHQAAAWLRTHLPPDAVVVTDDVLWLDVVEGAGLPREQVIWFYKLDLDPEVAQRYPDGWQDVDYIVSSPSMRDDPDPTTLPNVTQALSNSEPVITFGTGTERIEIRLVTEPTT